MKQGIIRWIIACILLLWFIKPCIAEPRPAFDIVTLVHHAPIIFSAKPLLEASGKNQSGTPRRRFLVLDQLKNEGTMLPDTVEVEGWDSYLAYTGGDVIWNISRFSIDYTGFPIDSFDYFVFFGNYHPINQGQSNWAFYPLSSGIRAFESDTMYVPQQEMIPGPYFFHPKQMIHIKEFTEKTIRTVNRVETLLKLHQIEPFSAHNKALFEWVETNLPDLKSSNSYYCGDREDNWGEFKWLVFEWINEHCSNEDAMRSKDLSQIVRNRS